jgi:DNA-binding CsgD family transcriptional regulator
MFSGQIIDEVAVAETEFYNDWMKPQGVPLNHLGVLLNRSSDTVAVLALAPASKTYERDASDYATALKMLVPHFKRALLFNRKLGHLETAHASLKAVFESVASPAFVVDASCRLIECNSAAQAFLKGGKSLKFRSGIVTAQTLRPSLAELVGRVLATHRPEAMLLPEENGDLYCWIMPLRKETDAHVPCQPTHLLILLTTPSKRPLMTADQLGRLWRLTSAEARLAEALVQGSTLREYAAATGVSLNTVRNQCTAIFTKTGVTRQSELVNLIGAAQRAAGAWHHE